jgi:hypothetical protein
MAGEDRVLAGGATPKPRMRETRRYHVETY